jgi:hypothetical protein
MEANAKFIEKLVKGSFPDGELLSTSIEPDCQSSIVSYRAPAEIAIKDRQVWITFISLKKESGAALVDFSQMSSDITKGTDNLVLLFSYVSPEKQSLLKKLKLNYIDEAGNAWIELLDNHYYIDRQGFKPVRKVNKSPKGRNVFSDKSSLVLRLLLYGDGLGVREISRRLSGDGFPISSGYASKVVQSLVEERYAMQREGGVFLARRRELLDDWTVDYKKRNRPEQIGLYFPSADPKELIDIINNTLTEGYAIGGLAGAGLIDAYASFDAVDVFVKDPLSALAALIKKGAKEADRGANVNVITPYYAVSTFYGAQTVKGAPVTSDLQLYLDLLCQPIRGLEAAEHLRKQRLDSRLRLSEETENE